MSETTTSVQTFYPAMRYADARAAIAWLVKTFGFEEVVCYPADDGSVAHAELRFHDGMVILSSARYDGSPIRPPAERGGLTGSIYVAVPAAEIDAHHARAKAAGARIHMDINDPDYGPPAHPPSHPDRKS